MNACRYTAAILPIVDANPGMTVSDLTETLILGGACWTIHIHSIVRALHNEGVLAIDLNDQTLWSL